MAGNVVDSCKQNMEKRIKGFDADLLKVRTGRASISLLDGIKVDYYGTPTPLNQVATLTTPDARTITVAPYEKKLIQDIEKSIMKADLGIQPTNDGNVVRIPIPALTEERRKDIVKNLKKLAEEAKVAIRNIRRDANDEVKKQLKDKVISEDDGKRLEADVQKHTDGFIKQIDERLAKKEQEVMKV
ncbi:MAG: ribosome recycling factor [Deltaproteobacteria bacterium]|nr:ribosome recycling factor [Deltaproteobacteria bacterium]